MKLSELKEKNLLIPIVIEKFSLQMKHGSILLPSKQLLFKDRSDAEGSKRGAFFECEGNFPIMIGIPLKFFFNRDTKKKEEE